MSFSKELHDELAAIGVRARLIEDRPERWRVGSMVLSVDRAGDRATLQYARQPVARGLRCDAAAVAAGYRRAAERLAAGSLSPAEMFEALASAYGAALAERGAPAGSRIALVELASGVAGAAGRSYSRAQFAYDLARLRRERQLCQNGARIELGVATGTDAARKSKVVWIDDGGSGQYFATLRILPERPPEGVESP